jgi:hypothetical protein
MLKQEANLRYVMTNGAAKNSIEANATYRRRAGIV